MALPFRRNKPGLLPEGGPLMALLSATADLVFVVGTDGRLRYQSLSVADILGYEPGELAEHDPWAPVYHTDRPLLEAILREAAAGGAPAAPLELRMHHKQGGWRYLEFAVTNMRDDPQIRGLVVAARDITARKEMEALLTHQAYTDQVTGLANRTRLTQELIAALAAQDQHGEGVGLLFLDLDGFKLVNDSLGHSAGDHVLRTVAGRLRTAARPGDLVARFGGDEFVLLLSRISRPEIAGSIAAAVLRAMREPIRLGGRDVVVGVSIGIALSPPNAPYQQAEDIIRDADTALYAAKGQGKDRAVLFTPQMNSQVLGRLTLEADLRVALDRRQFQVYYQPTFDLRRQTMVGAEALVRWQHPTQGLVTPGRFLSVVEDLGLIGTLGEWVLEEACAQAEGWKSLRRDEPPLQVSVNLSPHQFEQADLAGQVLRAVRRSGLAPGDLKLEITEAALLRGVEEARAALSALRGAGIRIALDDFGTGYSSLQYLRQFPADTLKVDQSFIAHLDSDQNSLAIVRAVTDLAHALGMDVTVEGVETAAQVQAVRTLACDVGQGFYFARPAPAGELHELLRAGSSLLRVAS